MSILISPSNSTGWGLGVTSMYGGALTRSGPYTVAVRSYYRRPWGSVRKSTSAEIDDTIESVVRSARRYRRGGRRRRRAAAAASGDSISSAIESVVRGARRYARRRDRAIDSTINSVVRSARRYSRATRALRAARRVARSAARRARTARWRRIHRGVRIRRART